MNKNTYQKNALLVILLLVVIAVASLLWIFSHTQKTQQQHGINTINNGNREIIADIYQIGTLLQSISLSSVEENYRITISGENGAVNEIEVRPGSIGITSANCPDKLCVHQGYISSSLLPITCLPNRLVIRIRQEDVDMITPDIVTY